jgi:hypothetical protein
MAVRPKLKVNLFKVIRGERDQPLDTLLNDLFHVPLERRVKRVRANDVRLEHIVRPRSADNDTDFWLLDFVYFRDTHGPGKAGRNVAIQGFDMQADDFFGEETAALYDPATDYMILQYNHHGVKAKSVRSYLNNFFEGERAPSDYELVMKLDAESEAKLAAKQHITKARFKIAPVQMTAAHRAAGVSLDRVLRLNESHNGVSIEVTISAERGNRLEQLGEMLDGLRGLMRADQEQGTHVVSQFELDAKAHLDERAEKIDMLLPGLVLEVSDIEQGLDRRLTLASRWNALVRAKRGWEQIMRG